MKQTEAVLRLLRESPEGITSRDAWLTLGVSRLAARIHDLQASGHDIESEIVPVQSGDRIAHVSRYVLRENAQLRMPL